MVVEAKLGPFRNFVFTDGAPEQLVRGRGGWIYVVDPGGRGGRVRYDGWRDRLVIESTAGTLEIRIRWRNTTFSWRGRMYRVASTTWGRVTILEGTVPVVEGRTTWRGVRLDRIDPAFGEIQRELAVGLAQRARAFAAASVVVGV